MSKLERQGCIFLRSSRDIELVKRHGRRISTELFNLLSYKMGEGETRVGIVVGKRFGNAVRRNRAKRVFRALIRQRHKDLVSGQALLVFPKRESLVQRSEVLKQMWESSLKRANVFRPMPD
jgi:ribonuclease P protein component